MANYNTENKRKRTAKITDILHQYQSTIPIALVKPYVSWVIEQTKHIQQIPAPTFAERERVLFLKQQFEQENLTKIEVDDVDNLYGCVRGKDANNHIIVSAHTDTVFPLETDLSIHHAGNRMYGAGIGDNSIATAALLFLNRFLREYQIQPTCNIWVVAPSREEGLGDLQGMRAVMDRLGETKAVINLEGLALGFIYHGGTPVRRLKVMVETEGGHSWLHFGQPNAIDALVRIAHCIQQITPPTKPYTTYGIGIIEGGNAINALASSASFWLDMRSEEQSALDHLEAQVQECIQSAITEGVTVTTEIVGDRPGGMISQSHPLVVAAQRASEIVGISSHLESGSTDSNIPLSRGIPSVTIGITRGANAHRTDEYIETPPIPYGLYQFLLLVLTCAKYYGQEMEQVQ